MRLRTFSALLVFVLCACESQAPAPAPPETDASQVQAAARKLAADGAMCGGYPGIQCEAGSYCAIEAGQCKTIADVTGICRKKPQVCTQQSQPVCGCDNKTYGNSCMAAAAGASIASEGACK
jgi:Kazal-type serine protease inhibitor domain